MSEEPQALLIDVVECIGCRACMEACMEKQGFAGDPFEIEELSATAYTVVEEKGDYWVRKMCRHCLHPSCASVCPVGALRKTALGPVVYDADACIGCRYCMQACPFGIPRYEWNDPVPAVAKCDMCYDRLTEGRPPACVEACPMEAVTVGPRRELLDRAHRKIRENPDTYGDRVCGEFDVGGVSVLLLLPTELAQPAIDDCDEDDEPLPLRTLEALERVPGIVTVGGAFLLAVHWITSRRDEVARAEAEEARRRGATNGTHGGVASKADRTDPTHVPGGHSRDGGDARDDTEEDDRHGSS